MPDIKNLKVLASKLNAFTDNNNFDSISLKKDLVEIRNEISAEINAILKELDEKEKLDPLIKRRLRHVQKSSDIKSKEESILNKFNAVSIKNNNNDIISEFKFSCLWEKVELVEREPSYWLISNIDNNSFFLFPNPMIISKSNYVSTYQPAYNIKNFVYAGVQGHHIILSQVCIVKDGKIVQKGEGQID